MERSRETNQRARRAGGEGDLAAVDHAEVDTEEKGKMENSERGGPDEAEKKSLPTRKKVKEFHLGSGKAIHEKERMYGRSLGRLEE